MNKGICFDFGFVYKNKEEQVKAIKEAGYDCVMTSADPKLNKKNGTLKKQVKLLKKYGLKLSSLHCRYERNDLPHFFFDDKIGRKIEKNLIKDIKLAKRFAFSCLVVHLKGEVNQIGIDRFKRVLNFAEKLQVTLALENLGKNAKVLDAIFKKFDSDYLKFCWDVGHNNAFTPDIDFGSIYKDKLIALHLHDNLGAYVSDEVYEKMGYTNKYYPGEGRVYNPDMHTLNKYGNIDWYEVAKRISKVGNDVSLDYETLMCYRTDETANDVLKEVFAQANELNDMIMKIKGKTKAKNEGD